MADLASISVAIESVKLALGIAKDLKNATEAFNEAENRLKISELYINLSEARISLADAQDEIHKLQRQIRDLQEKINSVDDLEFRDGAYFRKEPIDGKPNGPFCPGCWESPEKLMATMSPVSGHFSIAGRWKCNSCGKYVR
ncbi:TPA: hypothetical protein ROI13_004942 [Escherichia coli]|uniref:Uncharacterized protein n=1 Tax=Citrobacter freundii TaxID=546 RepID=A0A9P3Z447_CITFR|nr:MULTISPECIES: hypothetical protein [Enterobacteriaceae]ECH0720341.1 hypothetical protein [Salmonella enterica]EFA7616300.1 hypothetical protein [Escherichia coli]EKD2712057.1 hypothetical protein [Escherichia coli]ELK6655559.1 hypothetical protein [Citrobacter freundii]EMB0605808.1 hypothetical protein [Escherichia coli]